MYPAVIREIFPVMDHCRRTWVREFHIRSCNSVQLSADGQGVYNGRKAGIQYWKHLYITTHSPDSEKGRVRRRERIES
jgi:hypothetical protein